MLVFIVCSFLLFAPALQGVWDFRAQFIFEAAVFLTGGFWLFSEVMSGRTPAFLSDKRNIPLLGAAFFSLLSAALSPVRALVMPEWWTFAAGLFMLGLCGSLKAGDLRRTDLALRISAWLIALLSLYQAFILKSPDISASLTNPNSLALFILMLLPLAIKWKDFFLLGALFIVLIWTQSAAALLALLATAGFYARDNMKAADLKKNWVMLIVMAAVAAIAVSQLEFNSFLDRLSWWRAALRMIADRPALGFGPGSFAYVYPGYHSPGTASVATVYVHNYYLEFLAENGFFAFFFWAWAAALRLKDISGLKKYALIAALVHSTVDFGLAVPANFFVFCYLLAQLPQSQRVGKSPLHAILDTEQTSPRRGEQIGSHENRCFQGFTAEVGLSEPRRREAPAAWPSSSAPALSPAASKKWEKKTAVVLAALGLACFTALCGVFSTQLKLERLRAGALSALYAGDYPNAEAALETAARLAPANPLVPELLGQVRLRGGFGEKDAGRLFYAAVDFERAILLYPYNAGVWRDLERLYASAGERRLLEGLRKRKAEVFK